jgi:C2 domain
MAVFERSDGRDHNFQLVKPYPHLLGNSIPLTKHPWRVLSSSGQLCARNKIIIVFIFQLLLLQVHKRTACPEFDEDFVFDVSPASLAERTLEILIYDATPSAQPVNPAPVSDECVGQVLVPFDETNLQATTNTIWLWKGVAQYRRQTEVKC